jgi:hypothetical protein
MKSFLFTNNRVPGNATALRQRYSYLRDVAHLRAGREPKPMNSFRCNFRSIAAIGPVLRSNAQEHLALACLKRIDGL